MEYPVSVRVPCIWKQNIFCTWFRERRLLFLIVGGHGGNNCRDWCGDGCIEN
jgi:hypothetical protein